MTRNIKKEYLEKRYVELIEFTLNHNHFERIWKDCRKKYSLTTIKNVAKGGVNIIGKEKLVEALIAKANTELDNMAKKISLHKKVCA